MNRYCISDRCCALLMLLSMLIGLWVGWMIGSTRTEPAREQPKAQPAVLRYRTGESLGLPQPERTPRA